ncbi:MAG: phosphotransferase [Alphaproteobacteria bacterium]
MPLDPAATSLLRQAGLPPPYEAFALAGGGNNRCFRVETGSDRRPVLLKAYFHHPDDPRDRLGHEFAFSRHAWDSGVRTLPEPLAQDPAHHLGLYDFLPGRRLSPGEVDEAAVAAALSFVAAVNHPPAIPLPEASEACFCLGAHVRTVERRLARLETIQATDALATEVRRFLADEVASAFATAVQGLRHFAGGDDFDRPGARCLSPSDFGFHNALRDDTGVIRFLDFEYAGWDDPGKLVCDFFCQEAVPVPLALFDRFALGITETLGLDAAEVERFRKLLPLYRIKWVCIILNDFLPVGRLRRSHAAGTHETDHRERQLRKARTALS